MIKKSPNSKSKRIDRLIYLGILLLLALLPFHAFLKTWFSSLITETNIDYLSFGSFLIGSWKEVLLVILLLLLLLKIVLERKLPFKLGAFDYAVLTFLAILVLSPFWTTFDLKAYVWGLKTNATFLLVYFLARSISWDRERTEQVLKIVLGAAAIVVVFGLLLYFVLPPDFLQHFGYTPYISSYIDYKPLPFVHGMGKDLSVARLASTLSGPNQLGTYLLIILGLILSTQFTRRSLGARGLSQKVRRSKDQNFRTSELQKGVFKNNYTLFELGFGALACLVLTFSRAAWLGALVAFAVLILTRMDWGKHWKLFFALLLSLIFAISLFLLLLPNTFVKDYLLRASSSAGHYEQTLEGLVIVAEHPFGLGLGQAGPVSRRLYGEENAIISENWYLQIAQEAGLLALLTWLVFLYFLVKDLLLRQNFLSTASLFFLIAISVDAFFLHAWADATTALIAFSLIGIAVTENANPHSK